MKRWIVLPLSIGVVAMVYSCVTLRLSAEREYAAYDQLRAMGATGDDWISFTELITNRPPVVQIDIPASIPQGKSLALIRDMPNLEYVGLAYNKFSDSELDQLAGLSLHSIRFEGAFPSDSDANRLSRFRGLRFLTIPELNLSDESLAELRSVLPQCRVSVSVADESKREAEQ
ncbi:hypothetical protein [Crateriforma conspicua]|nr:hypothetical protein [Crateriforma conspicua]